jgi:hypothetical protein
MQIEKNAFISYEIWCFAGYQRQNAAFLNEFPFPMKYHSDQNSSDSSLFSDKKLIIKNCSISCNHPNNFYSSEN